MPKKTFSLISLGCFRNNYDSQIIKEKFTKEGFSFRPEGTPVEALIINTCGFIDSAKQESLAVIEDSLKLKKKKQVRKIIVVGCLSQRYQSELKQAYPQVDQWQGVLDLSNFSAKDKQFRSSSSEFIKICEGCLNHCSFCAIPLIKGKLKSRPAKDILTEVRYLNRAKIKELNLIGQDITSWGKDFKPKKELTFLLGQILSQAKDINWLRLIYTHPRHFTDPLIDLIGDNRKICRYIDLPIQHINDRILKVMNRKTTKSGITKLISKIRKRIPGSVIRTSVIVGFPGETEAEFKELLDFLKETQFDRLGAFIYSAEEGTVAGNFKNQIHHKTKLKRYSQVMQLQKEISSRLSQSYIGKELTVLIEEKREGFYLARTEFDAPEVDGVVFVKRKNLEIGQFQRVKIIDSYDYDLVAV